MAGWMINLSLKNNEKKHGCMHIRIKMTKMKEENKMKNKTKQILF